jgi:hypothetical protein
MKCHQPLPCQKGGAGRRALPVQRLWLCLPSFVTVAADGCLTLLGQPEAYWTGGFAVVREGNPVAAWFLSVHPLAFAAAGVQYLLLIVGVVLVLPHRWAVVVAVAVPLAHAVAVAAWCVLL